MKAVKNSTNYFFFEHGCSVFTTVHDNSDIRLSYQTNTLYNTGKNNPINWSNQSIQNTFSSI